MSDREPSNPFASLFDVQQRMMRRGEDAVRRSIELQRGGLRVGIAALGVQRAMQRRGFEATRRTLDFYADSTAAAVPDERGVRDAQDATRRQLDALEDLTEESWDAVEDGADRYVAFLERISGASIDAAGSVAEAQRDLGDAAWDAATDTADAVRDGRGRNTRR